MTENKISRINLNVKKNLYLILEIIIFILVIWFYTSHSLLLADPSKPYSNSLAYRLQTNAFLNGKLFLSPHPFGSWQDYTWTERGMSQNWGLGVPLMRLPFEWVAKQWGLGPFPDRLIILFYLSLMITTLNISLKLVLKACGLAPFSIWGLLMRWNLISWILFCPAIANMIQYKFIVYGEAIFYDYIYSCILLSLLWIYILKPRNTTFLLLSLLSGFACLIRPSMIVYGSATILLASLCLYQNTRKTRLIILGTILFSLGIFTDLYFNYARFGSIFEFGYSASMSGLYPQDYAQRFYDYPFRRENFLNAANELIGATFLNHHWESPTFRSREPTFTTFNMFYLMILVGGCIFFILLSYSYFVKKRYPFSKTQNLFKIIYFSLTWALIGFIALFIFYMYNSYITDRYLCDLAPALNAILIVLILSILYWHNFSRWKKNTHIIIFLTALGILFYSNNKAFFHYHGPLKEDITNKKGVEESVDSFNKETILNPNIPETFYCGHAYPNFHLINQFSGWDITNDCLVFNVSSIYLPAQKCLTINYSFINSTQPPVVQVKRNLVFLKLMNSYVTKNNHQDYSLKQKTQRFCSDSFPANTIAVYTIGWVQADKLSWDKVPIKLNWISVSDRINEKDNLSKRSFTQRGHILSSTPERSDYNMCSIKQ